MTLAELLADGPYQKPCHSNETVATTSLRVWLVADRHHAHGEVARSMDCGIGAKRN